MGIVLQFTVMNTRPNRLYELRLASGLSQPELAARVGCSKMHISGIERGKREFSLSMMRKIADVLHVSTSDLLSRKDNPHLLSGDEDALIRAFREAEPIQRQNILRVTAALSPGADARSEAA